MNARWVRHPHMRFFWGTPDHFCTKERYGIFRLKIPQSLFPKFVQIWHLFPALSPVWSHLLQTGLPHLPWQSGLLAFAPYCPCGLQVLLPSSLPPPQPNKASVPVNTAAPASTPLAPSTASAHLATRAPAVKLITMSACPSPATLEAPAWTC